MAFKDSDTVVEWSALGEVFAETGPIQFSSVPLANHQVLATASVFLNNGTSVQGVGCAGTLEVAKLKAESELFERICYFHRLDRIPMKQIS